MENPSKRFDNNDKYSLDIRRRSRDAQQNRKLIRNESSASKTPRQQRSSSSLKYNSKPSKYSEYLDDISENVDTIYGRDQIDKLLERINPKYSNKISFDEFLQSLFNGEEEFPQWMSHQPSPRQESSSRRTATQMFIIFKEKVRNRYRDLVNLVPSLNGGPPSRIFETQFHNALIDMGYRMKDTKFDKLLDE